MFPEGFFPAVGEALLLMIIAAILGGLIVWLLMRSRYQTLLGQYNKLTGEYGDLENRYKALLAQYDDLKPKYQELQSGYDKQGRQLKECGDKRTELDMELTQIRPFKDKFEMLQVDFDSKSKAFEDLEAQRKGLEVRVGGLETALQEERDSNKSLNAELVVLQAKQTKEAAKQEEASTPAVEAPETRSIFSSPTPAPPPKPKKKKETAEETLERIKQKASNINFDRIGFASVDVKDDLKRVKGIGPFIEKKLNALGIYTWRQIANFIPEDEDIVNDAIEFFSGRIRRDNWSSQAEVFADEKDRQKAEENK